MDSMKELEKQTERLLNELTELRRENRLLTGRVNRLEKAARDKGRAGGLESKRAELQRRVNHLVERLETLDSR